MVVRNAYVAVNIFACMTSCWFFLHFALFNTYLLTTWKMVKSLHVKSCILWRVSIDFTGLFVCFSVFVVLIMCVL